MLPRWMQQSSSSWLRASTSASSGEWNVNAAAMALIVVPSIVFLSMVNFRHFHGEQNGLDDQLMDLGNSFGIMAEVVGSFLLLPVSKHSSIIRYLRWSPARIVGLHIWSGRIFVIGGIVHGLVHVVRWRFLAGESIVGMLLPPAACWTMDSTQYSNAKPSCVNEDTDCSCYDHFRNLTGCLSACFMVVIAVTSLHQVRRKFYRIFYLSHVAAAPLALIFLVFHWNRSILFLCPSLLYYTANSLTVMVEHRTLCTSHNGVKIVAVERIPCSSQQGTADTKLFYNPLEHHCISLTLEATETAVQGFRPGYYIQLKAPDISVVSHPFTINTVVGKPNQMRIIFKAMGPFTSKLSQRIQYAMPDQQSELTTAIDKMPFIYFNGFHGTPNRVRHVLQHDVAVMIAGGIGITPYLSLLHQVHNALIHSDGRLPTTRVVLVWACREAGLVEYVRREYLEPLVHAARGDVDFKFQFVVYHTNGDCNFLSPMTTYTDEGSTILDTQNDALPAKASTTQTEILSMGLPFAPSRFAVGSSSHWRSNILAFCSFTTIVWVGLICTWHIYTNYTAKDQVASRGWALIVMATLGISVAILANVLANSSYFRDDCFTEMDRDACTSLTDDPDALIRASNIDAVEMDELHFSTEEPLEKNKREAQAGNAVTNNDHTGIVTLEEKVGRPTVHQMLKYVDGARYPGLFTCGPLGLMDSVREQTKEIRRGASYGQRVALYEEAFEL
jgi:predicted ferric reductase